MTEIRAVLLDGTKTEWVPYIPTELVGKKLHEKQVATEIRDNEDRLNNGTIVRLKGYVGTVVIDGIDDILTSMLKNVHYTGIDIDFLEGERKVNNCDPFSRKDIDIVLFKP